MLIQFTVENFLSFHEATVFSLRATNDEQLEHHVVRDARSLSVLRAAALYGANAAGKSNLVLAMDFARRQILNGTRGDERIGARPFKLAPGEAGPKPSRFEFIFRHNNTLYSYGFSASARRVHEEWLFATFDKREVRLFERLTDEEGQTQVEFGPQFVRESGKGKGRGFLNFVVQGTRANQLFLTECKERNIEAARPVVEWFNAVLVIIRADAENQGLLVHTYASREFSNFLSAFLRLASTGIEDVKAKIVPFDVRKKLPHLGEEAHQEIEEQARTLEPNQVMTLTDEAGRNIYHLVRGEDGEPAHLVLQSFHIDENGSTVPFSISEESEGTQRLFHLIPALFMLKRKPQVLVIDEIDRRLHPLLTRLFIRQALDCAEDEANGQLIFTTHDTNLLDLDLLRRDEIWFVEKDAGGATHLASLAEWKLNGARVRHDLDIEKHYLRGRFGAIPFFGDTSRLLCEPATPEPDSPASAQEAQPPKAVA